MKIMSAFAFSTSYFIVTAIPVCNDTICLSWYNRGNHLVLTCHVPDLHKHIIFHAPSKLNDEYAFCVMPFPKPKCFSRHINSIIEQDPTTNRTTFTLQYSNSKDLNGNWSCSHGSGGDHTSTEVDLTPTQSDHHTSLEISAVIVIIILVSVAIYIILRLAMNYKCFWLHCYCSTCIWTIIVSRMLKRIGFLNNQKNIELTTLVTPGVAEEKAINEKQSSTKNEN